MGTAFLVNTVRVGGVIKCAGQLIDSGHEDVAAIAAAGGLLLSSTAPEVVAASALAMSERMKGCAPHELTTIMTSAVLMALVNGNLECAYSTLSNIGTRPEYREGRFYYGDNNLNLMTEYDDVTIQIGEEQQAPVTNKDTSDMPNCCVIYASGPIGQRLAVKKASTAMLDSHRTRIIGLTTHPVLKNQNGRATTFGLVRGSDTSALTGGNDCYISSTPGELTDTGSDGTTICCRVGLVMNKHPTDGAIFVFPVTRPRISGTTANRFSSPRVGEMYFDTDLGKPIWWRHSTSDWVDATGTPV